MRKAIEITENALTCDNEACDFKVNNVVREQMDDFQDVNCPKCGENLLTEKDLKAAKFMFRCVDILNFLLMPMMWLCQKSEEAQVYEVNPRAEKTTFKPKNK